MRRADGVPGQHRVGVELGGHGAALEVTAFVEITIIVIVSGFRVEKRQPAATDPIYHHTLKAQFPLLDTRHGFRAFQVDGFTGEAVNNDVVEMPAGACFEGHGPVVLVMAAGADQGHVIHGRSGNGGGIRVTGLIVTFESIIPGVPMLLNGKKLNVTAPPHIPVQGVIASAGDNDMLQIHGTAENFDAVVQGPVRLDMAHDGAVTATPQGQAVEFVVGINFETGKFYASVFHDAAG